MTGFLLTASMDSAIAELAAPSSHDGRGRFG
jgi:hypothetical protein